MSILLLILAGVVIYYLYITLQDYLKNPVIIAQEPKSPTIDQAPQTPYVAQSPAQKLQKTYEGASVSMLGLMLQAGIHTTNATDSGSADSLRGSHLPKSSTSPLQTALIEDFLHTLALHNKPEYEQDLRALLAHYAPDYRAPESSASSMANTSAREPLDCSDLEILEISKLAGIFLDNTYGEYKKRAQFVGFLLMLAWSDRELNHDEQDIILDIAAFLEIDNADFNALYESFEKLESSSDEALKAAKTLEQLFSEQKEQDQASLQQVFFTHIQKLCANARKKDKPQATLLSTLLACEQAYIDTLQQLESSSKSRAPKASKSPKSDDKSGDKVDSSLQSTFAKESSSQHSVDSTDSAPSTAPQNKPQTSVKKRDSSWDNI